jgi:hypothetical protein
MLSVQRISDDSEGRANAFRSSVFRTAQPACTFYTAVGLPVSLYARNKIPKNATALATQSLRTRKLLAQFFFNQMVFVPELHSPWVGDSRHDKAAIPAVNRRRRIPEPTAIQSDISIEVQLLAVTVTAECSKHCLPG